MDGFMRKGVSPCVDATGSLVTRSLVDEAEGEIWSNPVLTRDQPTRT